MNIFTIAAVICSALCLLMFFYLKWYVNKRTAASKLLAGELDERQTEVARLIAEIDRITDRDSQLVEERIKKLKEIIEDADKRIALYIKELERGRSEETLYSSLGRGIRDALNVSQDAPLADQTFQTDTIELSQTARGSSPQEARGSSSHNAKTGYGQAGYLPFRSSRVIPPSPPPETPENSARQETEPPSPPNKQQIRSRIDQLLNEGLPAEEIASRLGISIAEVNLAINLRRK